MFIAFAAVLIIELLRLPHRQFVDKRVEWRVKRALLAIVLVTALPSVYLAAKLVDHEVFRSRAQKFVRQEFQGRATHVVETRVAPGERTIELTLIGARVPHDAVRAIERRLPQAGLENARLVVHQAEDSRVDVSSIKADILADVFRDGQQRLRDRDATIAQLRQLLAGESQWLATSSDLAREFAALFPACADILVGQVAMPGGQEPRRIPLLSATCAAALPGPELKRADDWFRARTRSDTVKLLLGSSAPAPQSRRTRPR